MYTTTGTNRLGQGWRGLEGSITVEEPTTHTRCQADERRMHPIVEPAASLLMRVAPVFLRHPRARISLHHAAYAAYIRMKRAAEDAGIPADLLTIVSGYRSVAQQVGLWETALRRYHTPAAARVYVAPPGGSPHHTGRAIDLFLGIANDSANIPAQRGTAVYRWLVCNAAQFGFTPYSAEPWHWEFNPPGFDPTVIPLRIASYSNRASPVG